MLEPRSMDSLGHHHHTKKLSPEIALHFKVLCESKAMLPYFIVAILTKILNMSDDESSLFSNQTSNV